MVKNHSVGGTLVLWQRDIDPYIMVYPVRTSSFTPIVFRPPGYQPSVHVALYLPTHGRDSEFVTELASLKICLEELIELNPEAPVYLRGDANVNDKNTTRVALLQQFLGEFHLHKVHIQHKTYHHFVREGQFDSNVDVIIHSSSITVPERITEVMCQLDHPNIMSHHDIIIRHEKTREPCKPGLRTFFRILWIF